MLLSFHPQIEAILTCCLDGYRGLEMDSPASRQLVPDLFIVLQPGLPFQKATTDLWLLLIKPGGTPSFLPLRRSLLTAPYQIPEAFVTWPRLISLSSPLAPFSSILASLDWT